MNIWIFENCILNDHMIQKVTLMIEAVLYLSCCKPVHYCSEVGPCFFYLSAE